MLCATDMKDILTSSLSILFECEMKYKNLTVAKILHKWPGKKYFGIYRFLPIFFVLGAALEFSMINWQVGETNFYKTYKKRAAERIVEAEKS